MLALAEKQMLIQALGQVVYDEVQAAIKPMQERLSGVEKVVGDLPAGTDTAMQEWTRNYVMGALEALPKPEKGDKGDPGPPGKDGKDGLNGTDGKSVCLDDLHPYVADLVAKAVAGLPIQRNCVGGFINRAGHLFLSFSDGSNSDLGEVVGRDGKDCDLELARSQVAAFLATIEKPRDGIDGVGFDDMELEFDGERVVTFKFVKGDNAKTYTLEFPVPVHRGLWKPGHYDRADIVYRDGSMWIARTDTDSVPGHLGSNWQLCTKRGRDGRDLTDKKK